jgi:mannitol/fructose-specific phosphotransferase system IIA component (Ntr-type)
MHFVEEPQWIKRFCNRLNGYGRETKHSTVLERFWNRKKEYSTIFEKKTYF